MLTAPQANNWFLNQMLVPQRTRDFLVTQGIADVESLAEFNSKEAWKHIYENGKRPPRIPDPANPGQLIEQEPFIISARSLLRLQVAAVAVEYYAGTARTLTVQSIAWPRLKNFEEEYKAIKDEKENGDADPPKITKQVNVVKWLEALENFARTAIGARMCPLAYLLRSDVAVPAAAPALAADQPYSTEHGSVKEEMIARFSHTHPLYAADNATIFNLIEDATRGTRFSASIAPFRRRKDGRGAYLALRDQNSGPAYWDQEKRNAEDFLLNREFTGGTSLSLARFLSMHRAAKVTIVRCAEHIPCQIPDERACVGNLINNIKVENSDVKAALAQIKVDDTPGGLREDFERSVALLLPCDPVVKKGKGKRTIGDISVVDSGTSINTIPTKVARGPKTGVEFRYHKGKEYAALSKAKKQELRDWRDEQKKQGKHVGGSNNRGSGGGRNTAQKRQKRLKADIASVLKELSEQKEQKEEQLDQIRALLTGNASAVEAEANASSVNAADTNTAEISAAKLQDAMALLELGKVGKSVTFAKSGKKG